MLIKPIKTIEFNNRVYSLRSVEQQPFFMVVHGNNISAIDFNLVIKGRITLPPQFHFIDLYPTNQLILLAVNNRLAVSDLDSLLQKEPQYQIKENTQIDWEKLAATLFIKNGDYFWLVTSLSKEQIEIRLYETNT